jgi:hypothetical protein
MFHPMSAATAILLVSLLAWQRAPVSDYGTVPSSPFAWPTARRCAHRARRHSPRGRRSRFRGRGRRVAETSPGFSIRSAETRRRY